MALSQPFHTGLQDAVKQFQAGTTGITVSGSNATITGSLDSHQLMELIRKAESLHYDCKVVAGVLTLSPR